jgi:hypothetical protein
MMQREDVLRRYRHLRAIGAHHHSAALKFLARPAIVEHARRLGLMMGQTLIANSEEEMTLVFDLAIYTAKEGRNRAIDRYAKVAQLPPDSDERSMLDAMCHAQFSIWRVARQHDTCGLVHHRPKRAPRKKAAQTAIAMPITIFTIRGRLSRCMSCRHSQDTDFSALIAAGKGDQPIAKMRFRCTNCRSLRTNFVVSGSHIQPSKR